MERVTGIGGVFFKAKDPAALRKWYRTRLGIEGTDPWKVFPWRQPDSDAPGSTVWALFPDDSDYFGAPELTHAVDVSETIDVGVASLQAHSAYLEALGPEHPMADARAFHERIAEPNLFVKIPATAAGVPLEQQRDVLLKGLLEPVTVGLVRWDASGLP